jgi:hypothetical protein
LSGVAVSGYRLGVDVGTANTVAVLQWPDGQIRPLLFDGSPSLPSSVYYEPGGGLLVGRDAAHAARAAPERFEPNPKRRIDEPTVLLGDAELAIEDLIGAVLRRVAFEARRVAGGPVTATTLTCPAAWARTRRRILVSAAERAGLHQAVLVPEPVAAASSFLQVVGGALPAGAAVVVYDLGAGTFDASVVRRGQTGFEVVAEEGLSQAGGLDIDAAVVGYLGAVYSARQPDPWRRLTHPTTPAERRANHLLWEDVRSAKEMLSRTSSATVHIPLVDEVAPLGRAQLEQLARPVLLSTVTATRAAVAAAGIAPDAFAGFFLVGGSSRIPLVATLLHQAFGRAPTVVEQPELVVAEGSLRALSTLAPPRQPAPRAPAPPAVPIPAATLPASATSGTPTPPASPPPSGLDTAAPVPKPPRRRAFTRRQVMAIGLTAVVVAAGTFALTHLLGSDGTPLTAANVVWTTDATAYEDQLEQRIRFDCPGGGTADSVWGTDTYTTDSSVCTAAVHAGKISFEDGGKVVIVIRPGETLYAGTERHGVTSSSWNSHKASFELIS